ncbi:ADP-ribosyl-[dinitrogen reductase] hydrolase [Neisseria sp. HSC-16F19]|nr:ADP-ribosylglycohydrolase family protein [Neisseria sp. HSC-16F19]MCP2041799.1 ADP-ribosyl-[dinitrogen reductase] hydrolase [Neisseria sp. HSC-16F19]
MQTPFADKAAACLLGLACGDALGAAVEFYPRGRFAPLTDMVGGGKFRLQKGQWTDDTSMALCLGESLLACRGFDAHDQMRRYLRWLHEGHQSSTGRAFGVGKQTVRALFAYEDSGVVYSTLTDSRYSGNGSLMRLAPVVLYFYDSPQLAEYAELSSKTTHASAECLQACRYFAEILRRALSGAAKADVFAGMDEADYPHLTQIVRQDFKYKSAAEIQGSGYVVESLEAALWAFWQTDSLRAALLAAANLGDDADTTAAICGQLAGAFYGLEAIPPDWLACLYRADDIEHMARALAAP